MAFFNTARTIRLKQQRRGAIRVLAYFTVVTAAFGALGVRYARAEFHDQLLDMGREMADLSLTSENRESVTAIVLNGQRMNLGSSVTKASLAEVAKHYQEYCTTKSSSFLLDPTDGKPSPDANANNDVIKTGYTRIDGDENETAIICFAKGSKSQPTRRESLKQFSKSGSLGAIGDLRYMYAKRDPKKGDTLVLQAWTDDTFNLIDAFPKTPSSDVPGEDFGGVPRVPSSTRTLSVRALGVPYGLNVYRTTDTPEKVLGFYDKTMHEDGWFMIDPEMTVEKDGAQARGYVKKGVVVIVTTEKHPDDNATFVGMTLSGVQPEKGDKARIR